MLWRLGEKAHVRFNLRDASWRLVSTSGMFHGLLVKSVKHYSTSAFSRISVHNNMGIVHGLKIISLKRSLAVADYELSDD